jgi:hypothetical protein
MKVLGPPSSGSAGALTYQRSRAGQVVRSRRVPVNAIRLSQSGGARSVLARESRAWRTQTDATRRAWSDYASHHPVTDDLGQARLLSGFSWWIRVRLPFRLGGFSPPTLPSTVTVKISVKGVSVAISTGSTDAFDVTVTGLSFAVTVFFFAGPLQSPGSIHPAGMRRLGQATYAAGTHTVSFLAGWQARYGSLRAGQRVFWQVKGLTGQQHYQVFGAGSSVVT